VYTRRDGLHTQVDIGIEEGLKHESSIHCDELMSLPKSSLTNFIGYLPPAKSPCFLDPLRFNIKAVATISRRPQ
jgi:mRNA-degrading endonuclease toxin of MazEF toxin-antitoxin module